MRRKHGRSWDSSAPATGERHRRLRELAVLEDCVACVITGAWSLWKSIGRGLGCREGAFGYSSEKDGESEVYFPSDLPIFPNFPSLHTLCIYCTLLKIIVVLFELHSGRKQRKPSGQVDEKNMESAHCVKVRSSLMLPPKWVI